MIRCPLIILLVCAVFIFTKCAKPDQTGYSPETLTIIEERDIIPEGTAYDPVTDQVFISCMYKRKIIAIRQDSSHYDFIKEGQDSIWAPIGMEVDPVKNKLWVISGKGGQGILTRLKPADQTWHATLYSYDIPSARLESIYHVVSSVKGDFCFNDLTVAPKGDIYLTESLTNRIFVLPSGSDSILVFTELEGYTFLNGITHSTDGKFLFVSSTESLLRIDIETKQVLPLPYSPSIHPRPIDGLAFYANGLIGHQSHKINRFYFNETLDTILSHETIDSIGLDGSTTGELGTNGWYYYIANSQIRSGIDYKKMEIMPWDSLEPVEIKKIKLD